MPRYVVRYNRGWLLLCDVMVSIGDFGSSCRGSSPLTTTNQSNILRLSKPNQTRLKDWIRELVMVKTHINQNCRAVEPCHCLTLIFIGR